MMIEKFWIVVRDNGLMQATKRHTTRREALSEAERLCKKDGGTFFVMSLIAAVTKPEVEVMWQTPIEYKTGVME